MRSSGTGPFEWICVKVDGGGVEVCLLFRSELIDLVDDDLCRLELIIRRPYPTLGRKRVDSST